MELPQRKRDDVHLPDGAFGAHVSALRELSDAHDLAIGIVYAFDYRTRMLPFWYADKRMAPCSVRLLGDVLHEAGFRNLRIVLQQWTPRVLPSRMRLQGRPLDILLVSAMQVHAERAYALIRDAHEMGAARPLILVGGPKAIYEPTDFLEVGPRPGYGADCVITGEAFVLLDLLLAILAGRRPGETPLEAFEKARIENRLARIPGLVYLSPDRFARGQVAVNTGVQRLLRDLDELPMPDAGYRMLEPPHRRRSLDKRPCPPKRIGKLSTIASVITTQGCRFNCPFCPIPTVNQRTWRHKSPRRLAAEIAHIHETFGISSFFSTDDNFFNDRQTVIEIMTELSQTKIRGVALSERIRFFTEATEIDVYRNRDLLPLARAGGLAAIWFGIEDISARLVNKGQTASRTAEVFARLCELGIEPMAMMIHSDAQPLRSEKGDMSGLLDQADYLFDLGAVSYQCTYLGPAVGTRDFEPAARDGAIYERVGERLIPQAFQDGNHVVASRHPRPWRQQINLLRAYAAFYNPVNAFRAFLCAHRDAVGRKRLLFQLVGHVGLLLTAPRLLCWAYRLRRGPIETYPGLQPARIPMIDSASGHEINWAIEQIPSLERAAFRHVESLPREPIVNELENRVTGATNISAKSPIATTRPYGVLVADDEESLLSILETALRQAGLQVWTAADGGQALDTYSRYHKQIDLVLLDICMPERDGPQTWAAIQAVNGRVRCCFMSGNPTRYSEEQLFGRGAAAFFKKPFRLSELIHTMLKLITSEHIADRAYQLWITGSGHLTKNGGRSDTRSRGEPGAIRERHGDTV